jgi:predicted  nucleic acid-binding Zn-ribbon protein
MGQYLSALKNKYDTEVFKNNTCFICKNNIELEELITCVRCHIRLHDKCEKSIRGDKQSFCKCPACNRIGSLGFTKI